MFSFEGFVRINTFLTGVYRVAYLNVLWIATTVLGLGLFGVGPASYALAAYMDGWFRRGETPPVTRTFVRGVREQPWRAMVVSWVLLVAGAVIVTNVFRAPSWTVQALNVVALVVLAVAAAYVYPVMAATDAASPARQLASALLIGFGSLHWTILGATAVGLAGWLLWQFALPLLVLFGMGIPAVAVAVVTRIVFRPLAHDSDQPVRGAAHRSSIHAPATEQVA
ncbi:MAG: YesL family protein [Pseudonocardia sp.]